MPSRPAAARHGGPRCSDDGTTLVDFTSGLWRPYGQVPGTSRVRHGLSCDRLVAVHPSLLVGDAITVCVQGGVRDGLLVPAVATATSDWNDLLAPDHANPDPTLRRGLGYAPFAFDTANPNCPAGTPGTDTGFVRVIDDRHACHANIATSCSGGGTPAVADTDKSGDPPRITRNTMNIVVGEGRDHAAIEAELARLVRHELGHFLGLADYFEGCWRVVDGAGVVQPSAMSHGQLAGDTPDGTPDPAGCRSDDAVTDRDLDDLHAIYHPLAVSGLRLEPSALAGRWQLRWRPSTVTPPAFNAAFLGVARRELLARDPLSGSPVGPAGWELFGLQQPDQKLYPLPASADVHGYEYAVVGLTRGDHRRGEDTDVGLGLEHRALAWSGGRAWTAGGVSGSVSATPTRVAVAGPAAPIAEGASAVFAVSRTGATGSALTVGVSVAETGDVVAPGEGGPKSVTIPVGASSAVFEVATVDDGDVEGDSVVTVIVGSGAGYGVVSPGAVSVTVRDDDLPLVAVAAAGSAITEGESTFFALSRTGSAASPLTVDVVDVTVSEAGGDMVAPTGEGPRSVTIPAGDSSVSFSVATVDDSVDESDSTITVSVTGGTGHGTGAPGTASVTGGTGYGVVSPGTASVTETDDDEAPPPSVYLWGRSTLPVTEGASLIFEVSRGFGDLVTVPLTVNVRVAETGDMVAASGSRSVTIAAGDRGATFAVATSDDSVAEDDSVVTVELAGGTGYFSPSDSESVAVYDNDGTPPTVAIWPVQPWAQEGYSAFLRFTVIHTGATTAPLIFALTIAETGDMLNSTLKGSFSATIPAGANSATLTLGIRNDEVDEWLSTVTVAVASGAGHSVGSPGSASVVVYDDDYPAIGVRPVAPTVSEGTAAGFTVFSRTGPAREPVAVQLLVSETGDMASPVPLVSVTIPAGDTSAALEVPTVDDGDTEADSVVTAAIASVNGHFSAVHPSHPDASASVTVHDNENTAPRVTISSNPTPRFGWREGRPATFTVSRSGATSSALTVALEVTETGDAISGTVPTSMTIPAGETSASFDVATDDDDLDEDDSTVTARVVGGADYEISTPGSASIPVRDNDTSRLPEVEILQGTWDTIEGGALSFTVSRAGPRGRPLTVALSVSETGDVLSGTAPTSVTIPAGGAHATFEVSTDDDGVEEDASVVTVDIVAGAAYTVGTPGSARVPVHDNDAPPTVAVQPHFSSSESRPARFIVSRAGSTAADLTVELTITETGDMIAPDNEGPTLVTIRARETSATLDVPTVEDTLAEDDSTITASITRYTTGTPASASITASDDDRTPTVTIRSAPFLSWTEGRTAGITVHRSGPTTSPLTIELTVSETGDMIDPSREGPTSFTIPQGKWAPRSSCPPSTTRSQRTTAPSRPSSPTAAASPSDPAIPHGSPSATTTHSAARPPSPSSRRHRRSPRAPSPDSPSAAPARQQGG